MKAVHLLALAAVCAAESALFCLVAEQRYAWIYPRWHDQLQYLQEAYDGYMHARSVGFAQGVRQSFAHGSPQGSLHGLLALLAFEAFGPSRIAALSLNLAAFLALQAATFLVVRRISQSWSMAWAAAALLAALSFPWSDNTGSAIDFRLDWMTACAYGVALAAALAGNGFRSTRWMVFLGAAVGTAILLRFLTAVYFGLIFVALSSWLLTRPDRRPRWGRLMLAACVALGISGPALWHSRHAIFSYYWTEPTTGAQGALYLSHVGVVSKGEWLFAELLVYKIGLAAAFLGIGAAVALLVVGAIQRSRGASPARRGHSLESAWVVVVAFAAAPMAVLAMYPEKASPTVSILIPGAVWVILLVWISLARLVTRGAVGAIGGAVVITGALLFVFAETRNPVTAQMAADFRRINALDDYLCYRAEESGLERPRVAVTWVLDGLGAGTFQVLGFERHHRMVPFVAELPNGLLGTTREAVMRGLANSDFICLVDGAGAVWPFDRQMAEVLPEMRRWCDGNLRRVGTVSTGGFSASVYERPGLKGPAGGTALDLGAMMRSASVGPANGEAVPPAAPVIVSPRLALASTRVDFRFLAEAAYSPVTYAAESLPAGIHIDAMTGELGGRFPGAGDYTLRLVASNSKGSTPFLLSVHAEDEPRFVFLRAPGSCRVGEPVEITYGGVDAAGKLDFIEITDLTASRTLCRIPVPEDAKESWVGAYTLVFDAPGPREILTRTVRFDPRARSQYAFTDSVCKIVVAP